MSHPVSYTIIKYWEGKFDMSLKNRYSALKEKVRSRKEDFASLMRFVETQTAYLSAPASTRFHLCREQGLLEHSVNVAETLLLLRETLMPALSEESCVIVALLHDLGKAGVPGQPQYIENLPSEKQQRYGYSTNTPFRFNNQLTYLSVPIRSLYLILPYLPLTQEEAQAIAYHDGQYVTDNHGVAAKESELTLLLQYADNWSGFVIERKE